VSTDGNRATGVPRSVTTISSPAWARSIQLDSSARKVLIAGLGPLTQDGPGGPRAEPLPRAGGSPPANC